MKIIENPYKANTKQMQHQCTINENQWKSMNIIENHWNHWKPLKTNTKVMEIIDQGPQKDPKRTPKGPAEDPERTPKGPRENPKRTPFGSPRTCAFGQSLHCAQSLLVCAKFARSRKVCAFHGACPGCCLIFKLQMLGLLIIPLPFWFNIWEAKPLISSELAGSSPIIENH